MKKHFTQKNNSYYQQNDTLGVRIYLFFAVLVSLFRFLNFQVGHMFGQKWLK